MYINPYGAEPVTLAAELATRPPRSPRELTDRCRAAGLELAGQAAEADLAEVLAFLDDWLVVVDTPDPTARAAHLNALLARHCGPPRLTDHDGHWHLHYRPDEVTVARQIAVIVTVGTALHLTSRGMDRLARCGADDCTDVLADTTRNGRKVYCSPRCTNRSAVRRHRARALTTSSCPSPSRR